MPRWIHRLLWSRRAAMGAVAATAILAVGSCSGALLANYTIAGTAMPFYANSSSFAATTPPMREASWSEQATTNLYEEVRPEPVEASYVAEGATTEYAIGE